MKNPTIATILNIIPGLGYLYVGGKKKIFGVLLLVGMVSSIISSFDPSLSVYSEEAMSAEFTLWSMLGLASLVLLVAAFMYDGYTTALESNARSSKKK
jgi:membrane-bound ClpP family serine protease